jgi:hypothetical protein
MNQPEKLHTLTPEELAGTAVVAEGVEDLGVRPCRVRYFRPAGGPPHHPLSTPNWEDLYGIPACAEGVEKLTRQAARRNPPLASNGS